MNLIEWSVIRFEWHDLAYETTKLIVNDEWSNCYIFKFSNHYYSYSFHF